MESNFYLEAMPSLTGDTDFDLASSSGNQKMLKYLESKPHSLVYTETKENIEGKLFTTGSATGGYYYMVSDKRLVYCMHYKKIIKKLVGIPVVTQTAVWSDPRGVVNRGLTHDVVFGLLIPRFKVIMSDRIQTNLGQRLWLSLISNALEKSLNVGLVDFNTHRVLTFDSNAEFRLYEERSIDGFWDWNSMKHQDIRFLISKPNIPQGIPASSLL